MQTSTSTSSEAPLAGGPAAETTEPTGDSNDSLKWFAKHQQLTELSEGQRAAWDGVQRSFRFAPRPYRWREIIAGVGLLYITIIGIPAAGGVWAAWRLWQEVHG